MKPLFVCVVGSKLYGTATEQSDTNFKGFGFAEVDEIIGLKNFEQQEYNNGVLDGPSKIEGTIFDVRRYLNLCLKGNPTVMEISFANSKHALFTTALGEDVRKFVRDNLLTKSMFKAYSAYHRAQLRKLQSMERTGKRAEIVLEHGYDSKFAYHAYRLAVQCINAMKYGYLEPTLTDAEKQVGLEIRSGKFSKDDVLKLLETVDSEMYEAYKTSSLREAADFNLANRFITDLYKNYIGGKYDMELTRTFSPF